MIINIFGGDEIYSRIYDWENYSNNVFYDINIEKGEDNYQISENDIILLENEFRNRFDLYYGNKELLEYWCYKNSFKVIIEEKNIDL